jgi:hypothetical protein
MVEYTYVSNAQNMEFSAKRVAKQCLPYRPSGAEEKEFFPRWKCEKCRFF